MTKKIGESEASQTGFYAALRYMLQVVKGGFCMAGPPCSLFVWLSTTKHRRSSGNAWGNTSDPDVRLSNVIATNAAMVLGVGALRGVRIMLEQPSSSRMFDLPPVRALIQHLRLFDVFTWFGAFQHPMPKPSTLWTNLVGARSLTRRKPKKQNIPKQNRTSEQEKDFHHKSKCGKWTTGGRWT